MVACLLLASLLAGVPCTGLHLERSGALLRAQYPENSSTSEVTAVVDASGTTEAAEASETVVVGPGASIPIDIGVGPQDNVAGTKADVGGVETPPLQSRTRVVPPWFASETHSTALDAFSQGLPLAATLAFLAMVIMLGVLTDNCLSRRTSIESRHACRRAVVLVNSVVLAMGITIASGSAAKGRDHFFYPAIAASVMGAAGVCYYVVSVVVGRYGSRSPDQNNQIAPALSNQPFGAHPTEVQGRVAASILGKPVTRKPDEDVKLDPMDAARHLKYGLLLSICVAHFMLNPATVGTGFWRAFEFVGFFLANPGLVLVCGVETGAALDAASSWKDYAKHVAAIAVMYVACQCAFFRYFEAIFVPMCEANMPAEEASKWIAMMTPWGGRTAIERFFSAPFWHLWVIQALGLWALVLPLWRKLRVPFAVAIVIGLVPVYAPLPTSLHALSLSKALEFFPFFTLGTAFSSPKTMQSLLDAGSHPYITLASFSAVLLVSAFSLACPYSAFHELGGFAWIGSAVPGDARGGIFWWTGAARLAFCVLAVGTMNALLNLMPRVSTPFSRSAGALAVPYALHFLVPLFLVSIGWYGAPNGQSFGAEWQVYTVLIACATVATLACVVDALRAVVKPMPWLFEAPRKTGVKRTKVYGG